MLTSCVEARTARATAIGPCVPAVDFAFRVHGVFAHALNLRPEGRARLVTLTGHDADDLPCGIRLGTPETFDGWPVRSGTPGRRCGDVLEFEGASRSVSVSLAGAARAAAAPLPRVSARRAAGGGAWRACGAWLAREQERRGAALRLRAVLGAGPAATVMGRRLAEGARALGGAVSSADVGAAAGAASHLLGLGEGLTPSGDDLLCGVLAALAGTRDRATGFGPAWGAELGGRLHATNAIAATYLSCAIEGCFTGTLAAFAATFADDERNGTAESSRAACERLCATGHSSGMDLATGYLCGLRWWSDQESRRHAA